MIMHTFIPETIENVNFVPLLSWDAVLVTISGRDYYARRSSDGDSDVYSTSHSTVQALVRIRKTAEGDIKVYLIYYGYQSNCDIVEWITANLPEDFGRSL